MNASQRVLVAAAILLVDLVAVFIPVAAMVMGYVILARPPWFREWVVRLYGGEDPRPKDPEDSRDTGGVSRP